MKSEIDAYFAKLGEPARTTLTRVRRALRAACPKDAVERFSYGVPAFVGEKGIAGYSAGAKFCSYYPMSGKVIRALAKDLAAYETTSGAIHFPLDEPLPATLVKKLVKARLAEIGKTKRKIAKAPRRQKK